MQKINETQVQESGTGAASQQALRAPRQAGIGERAPDGFHRRLQRLLDGDPLGLRLRVMRALRKTCLLANPDALVARCLSELVLRGDLGPKLEPERETHCPQDRYPDRVVQGVVDAIIADLERGIECDSKGRPGMDRSAAGRHGAERLAEESPDSNWLDQLSKSLDVPSRDLDEACKRFNGLPRVVRQAIRALVFQRNHIEVLCRESIALAQGYSETVCRGLREVLQVQQFPLSQVPLAQDLPFPQSKSCADEVSSVGIPPRLSDMNAAS